MATLQEPICCPSCGETKRLVLLTPSRPGPDGWGRRCKTCGRRWSLDDEAVPGESQQRAEAAVGLARHLNAAHSGARSLAEALDAELLDSRLEAIFAEAICCSECGAGYDDAYWQAIYPDGDTMPELDEFVCDHCRFGGESA